MTTTDSPTSTNAPAGTVSREDIERYAGAAGFPVDEIDIDQLHGLVEFVYESVERFRSAAGRLVPPPAPTAPRDPGRVATRDEDPLNAVVRWVDIAGAPDGPLAGKRLAVKDLVSVAGVPMTLGSAIPSDYAPTSDAVVIERLLGAGARVVAMTNLENLALSGGGETSAFGPVRNPFDPTRAASGSSGGSAASLSYDTVDIAIGTDQGGSVRLPAAWCGYLGLKPTFGLVPYTGIASLDRSVDHVGPLTRTVEDMAAMMDAMSGPHPSDPRQPRDQPTLDFAAAVAGAGDRLDGLRIGIVTEALDVGDDGHEGRVETVAAFLEAMDRLRELGAEIVDVSMPEHVLAGDVMFAALIEGIAATHWSHGEAHNWTGSYNPAFAQAMARGFAERGASTPITYLAMVTAGELVRDRFDGTVYGEARNASTALRAVYDDALSSVDVIAMPTATHYAHEIAPDATAEEIGRRGWTMTGNTPIHNVTGHPALSMPAAASAGLPVGVMLVAKHFEDDRLLAIARTYERRFGWLPER
ncbi:amidase [Labedella gwakjiensis]|uniref:Amidase n=1 Tax=Labedella gwakjiensis TaxID=390269 RepID=A0A2P8GWJ5_9MICO|nr:amidase family protein [Labedella gwakjiensis]PSL38336.1 amidase [Labedella gwakjiensis]RUQ87131.1 amidase [Labedella gwakjiensis]